MLYTSDDMLRYAREGHLSYYKLDRLIPPEVVLTKNDVNFLSRAAGIMRKGMRRIIGRMAKFLGVTTIICSDFLPLINRHCSELNLPIHGSTGNFDDELIIEKITSCKRAASDGYKSLLNDANSIEAVETTLLWLECERILQL